MATKPSKPKYSRINTGGDWGVGIATGNFPQNKDIILSTDGLVGCNALFFSSPGGIWLCHVMSAWGNPEKLKTMKIEQKELFENLNQAVADFRTNTGTDIATVFICRSDGNELPKILESWAKSSLPSSVLKIPETRKGAWYMTGNSREPVAGSPPVEFGEQTLNYQEEYYYRARHTNVGILDVWNRPFIPSASLGRKGPMFEDDPRTPSLPMSSGTPAILDRAESENKAGHDVLAARSLGSSLSLSLDALAPAPHSSANMPVGSDSSLPSYQPVPVPLSRDALAARIAGAQVSFDNLSAGFPTASIDPTLPSGSMHHPAPTHSLASSLPPSMSISRPTGAAIGGGEGLPVEIKGGEERLKAIDLEQQQIKMQMSLLKRLEVHGPVARRPGDFAPPLMSFYAPVASDPVGDRTKQLSLLQSRHDELETEKRALLSNKTGDKDKPSPF